MDDVTRLTRCPRCGADLSVDTPEGLCAACLLAGVAGIADPWSGISGDEATVPSADGGNATGASAAPRLTAGQTFGPYRIERLLGRGGMGDVYEAEHLEQGRRVALKVLNQRLSGPEDRARFLREGQLAASINHPHTCYIFGSEDILGVPAIAMELLPGGTLKDRVQKEGPLSPVEAVDVILQVIAGLDAAHAAGILHRDIKPANCFTDRDGVVKVGDFGLSISTMARHGAQTSGLFEGTPQFAAPEQIRGEALDVRADIYAVGATLYYLLTGRPPFDDDDLTTLVARVKDEPPRSPTALRPDVPKGLANVVVRCLAKDRVERVQTYAALTDGLQPFSSTAPMAAPLDRRFIAGVIDWALLGVFTVGFGMYAAKGWMYTREKPMWLGVTPFIASLLYWGVFEGHWGASIGKRMCGLRMVGPSGATPGVPRATWRWMLFGLAAWIAVVACGGHRFGPFRMFGLHLTTAVFGLYSTLLWGQIDPWLMLSLSFPIQLGLLFWTARRRNGFAALHDVVSRVRVVETRTREARRVAAESVVTVPLDDRHPRRMGPYDVLGVLGTTEQGELLKGFDAALRRPVWINALQPGTPPVAPNLRDLTRPGRLRWLNGRRHAEAAWDAYEAPEGAPFVTIVRTPQPWSAVRCWLSDLAREFEAADGGGIVLKPDLDHVWITRSSRAILLDFRTPGVVPGSIQRPSDAAMSGQAFLADIARIATGRTPKSGEGAAIDPRVAMLPLSARTLLTRLAAGGFESWHDALREIDRLAAVPDRVTRQRRMIHLTACGLLPVLGLLNLLLFMTPALSPAVHAFAQMYILIALAGVTSALLVRGGLLMRLLGIAVVTADGREASRLRALARALVAWSPIVPMAWLMNVQSTIRQVSLWRIGQSFSPYGTHAYAALGVAVVFVGCAIWGVLRPERGLQDRIAGTWLVPR